jgi:hypothetical protein
MKFWCRFGHEGPQQAVLSAQQVVPQVRAAQVAWQVPAEQVCPDEQERPHTPQFAASVWRFTQLPLQSVSPLAQAREQAPLLQIWSAVQTLPQRPQLTGSVLVLVQIADAVPGLQRVSGGRHWQLLALQTLLGTQTFPQAPQFAPLVAVSTHRPVVGASGGQNVIVFGGVGLTSQTQLAPRQLPRPQPWKQVPQLAGSVWRFTHRAPQVSGVEAGHSQRPATQLEPA